VTLAVSERGRNMILGALVADAAAMGLHWVYDQAHLAQIAPQRPEFLPPDPAQYAGVPAFFAHPTRRAGDPSQYGEQALVMLAALAANGGEYDALTYGHHFRSHFGYGGAYVGYIDHATRDARALPFDGDTKITTAMVNKALALIPRHDGADLRAKFEEAVRITHDDDAIVAHGFAVLQCLLNMPAATGADDQQLPAIAKLPALVAALDGASDADFDAQVLSAVRTTNDHPRALAFGQVCGRMMRAALRSDDLAEVIAAGRAVTMPEVDVLIADALARQHEDTNTATAHFGMACDLNYGVPSVVHNIITAPDFTTAVRRNIWAGGDNCGRAILLGAILGAVYGDGAQGIPADWAAKLTVMDRVRAACTTA